MEMKKYKLGDLIDVSRGKSLAGEFYATSGNLVRLTMGNFDYINNCFKQNTSKDNLFFSGKVEEKFILNAGDIITPLTEQTPGLLGSTARIPESGKYIQSQDVALVRCKKDKLDDGFAYYLISSESVKKQLGAAAQQTKIRHTSPDKIKDCTVYIPEISIQKKIGNILSTLDKRIENLRAQNRVLEQTAKTIYDYTFLQCAGHQTTYNKTLNRNIPVDWEIDNLYRIADFTNGLACQKYRPITEKEKLPVIKIREMHDGVTADTEFVRSDIPEKVIVNPGDLLFSWSASLEVMMWNGVKGGLNQHIFKVTPKEYFSLYFVYFQLKDYIGNFKRMAEARKTTMGHITTDHLNQSRIAIPDEETMKRFSSQITPLFKKQLVNSQQIEALTTQRNTLLPLLMTGQIEVV